jgi:hypothetical protein
MSLRLSALRTSKFRTIACVARAESSVVTVCGPRAHACKYTKDGRPCASIRHTTSLRLPSPGPKIEVIKSNAGPIVTALARHVISCRELSNVVGLNIAGASPKQTLSIEPVPEPMTSQLNPKSPTD